MLLKEVGIVIIMVKDKVSIIIPTYRGEKTIVRAVNSALSQNYDHIEVIVVDDNDPNSVHRQETEKKLSLYLENKRILLIKHDRNMNGSAARNTGARMASGEFLSFLDDDDEYYPERILKAIATAKESGADFVFSNVLIKKNNRPSRLKRMKECDDWFYKTLLDENIIGTGSNLFVRKRKYDEIGGFDEKLVRNQDLDFMLAGFSKNSVVACIDEVLVIKHETNNLHISSYSELCKIKKYLGKKYGSIISTYSNETERIIIEMAHRSLLKTAIQNKDMEGIDAEKRVLNNRLSIKELIDISIAKNNELSVIRKMYDRFRELKLKIVLLFFK